MTTTKHPLVVTLVWAVLAALAWAAIYGVVLAVMFFVSKVWQ